MAGEFERHLYDGQIIKCSLKSNEKIVFTYKHFDAEIPAILAADIITVDYPIDKLLVYFTLRK